MSHHPFDNFHFQSKSFVKSGLCLGGNAPKGGLPECVHAPLGANQDPWKPTIKAFVVFQWSWLALSGLGFVLKFWITGREPKICMFTLEDEDAFFGS